MSAHIYLVGFMGSGKSHWGKRLAEHLGRPFFDLDEVIEAGEGLTVSTLFSSIGENGFRELERRYLHQMEHQPPSIVATGGGTPCFFDNMAWMNAQGTTVYLKISMPILHQRLVAGKGKRPLLIRNCCDTSKHCWSSATFFTDRRQQRCNGKRKMIRSFGKT